MFRVNDSLFRAVQDAALKHHALIEQVERSTAFPAALELAAQKHSALFEQVERSTAFPAALELAAQKHSALFEQADYSKAFAGLAAGLEQAARRADVFKLADPSKAFAGLATALEQSDLIKQADYSKAFAGLAAGLEQAARRADVFKLADPSKAFAGLATALEQSAQIEWIDDAGDVAELTEAGSAPATVPSGKERLGVSRREIAVYVACAVFILAYLGGAAVLRYEPGIRAASQVDGPSPYEVAMALALLAYGIVLKYGRD